MEEKWKMEWAYLLVTGIIIFLAVVGWQKGEISDISTLFSIGGAILTLIALIAFPIEIGGIRVSSFLMQTALLNLVLGIPSIRGIPPPKFAIPPPYVILVATATEEIFRIGAFHLTLESFQMPKFAVFVSGIVFAAMHIYWHPTEWFSAIAGGALFSIMLMIFQSQTACVVSHFMYDMLIFQYVSALVYFPFSFLILVLAQIPIIKKMKV